MTLWQVTGCSCRFNDSYRAGVNYRFWPSRGKVRSDLPAEKLPLNGVQQEEFRRHRRRPLMAQAV